MHGPLTRAHQRAELDGCDALFSRPRSELEDVEDHGRDLGDLTLSARLLVDLNVLTYLLVRASQTKVDLLVGAPEAES